MAAKKAPPRRNTDVIRCENVAKSIPSPINVVPSVMSVPAELLMPAAESGPAAAALTRSR